MRGTRPPSSELCQLFNSPGGSKRRFHYCRYAHICTRCKRPAAECSEGKRQTTANQVQAGPAVEGAPNPPHLPKTVDPGTFWTTSSSCVVFSNYVLLLYAVCGTAHAGHASFYTYEVYDNCPPLCRSVPVHKGLLALDAARLPELGATPPGLRMISSPLRDRLSLWRQALASHPDQ